MDIQSLIFTSIAIPFASKAYDNMIGSALTFGAEKIIPKVDFRMRLIRIVQDTSEQFSTGKPVLERNKFYFYQSGKLISSILESRIYNLEESPIKREDYIGDPNIPIPEQEEIDSFFDLLLQNIKEDQTLRKLYVKEYYQEAIFEIQKTLDSVDKGVKLLIQNIAEQPQLFRESKVLATSKTKFVFRHRVTPLLGREDKLTYLEEFLKSEGRVAWSIITGKGGVGKSRLALEFGISSNLPTESWGFISIKEIETFNWKTWQPINKTLIIIDYVANSCDKITELIKTLINKESLAFQVRILLIERDTTGDWWDNFIHDYDVSGSFFKGEIVSLEGLNSNSLIQIVEKVLKVEKKELTITKNQLEQILINTDPQQRPLFAMFVGIALANGQHIRDWNQSNLLDFQLEHEDKFIARNYTQYNEQTIYEHKNVTILATLCGGLTVSQVRSTFDLNINWFPNATSFDGQLVKSLSDSSDDYSVERREMTIINGEMIEAGYIEYFPIYPDILGEYFVLKNLMPDKKHQHRDINRTQEIKKLAYKYGYIEVFNFIGRILQDFPVHSVVSSLLNDEYEELINTRGSHGKQILSLMKSMYKDRKDILETFWNYTKELAKSNEIWPSDKSFMDDPHRVYQEATMLMIWANRDNLDAQVKYYNIMRSNTIEFDKRPANMGITRYTSSLDDTEKTRSLLSGSASPELYAKWMEENVGTWQDIPCQEAHALSIIITTDSTEDRKLLIPVYMQRLDEISSTYTDPRIKIIVLDTWIKQGLLASSLHENKLRKLFDAIKNTPTQIGPINTEREVFHFVEAVINEFLRLDKADVLFYFKEYFEWMLERKKNPESIYSVNSLTELTFNIFSHYYDKNQISIGNTYLAFLHMIQPLYGPIIYREPTLAVQHWFMIGQKRYYDLLFLAKQRSQKAPH